MLLITGKKYNCLSKFIFDGDTLSLDFQSYQFKARLQWIDSPESQKTGQNTTNPKVIKHWEWAEKAKTALMDLVAGKSIITIPIEKDQYDRWVCDCYLGTVKTANNLQIQLCKAGMAVSYLPFNRFSYSTRELAVMRGIITETANANRRKTGIWSEPDFMLPYEFKKLNLS